MAGVDKKWCGRKCGDSPTLDKTNATTRMKDAINCPSGYDWWDKGTRNNVYGFSTNGWKTIPHWGGGSFWLKKCIRQIPGSKLNCALGEYSASKCPIDFAKNQPQSIKYMNKYCSGDGIVKYNSCKQWENVNPTSYTNKLAQFCTSDMNNVYKYQECKTYCKDNPGKCENVMYKYCSLHKDDKLCGCINSPLNDFPAGSKGRPPATCFDNTCMLFGYKPDANARGVRRSNINECGDFMDCSQNINISDKAFLERVKISQVCIIEKKNEIKEKADKKAAAAAAAAEKNQGFSNVLGWSLCH